MKKNKFAILAGVALFMAIQNPANAANTATLINQVTKCSNYYNSMLAKYPQGSSQLISAIEAKSESCERSMIAAHQQYTKNIEKLDKMWKKYEQMDAPLRDVMPSPTGSAQFEKINQLTLRNFKFLAQINNLKDQTNTLMAKTIELRDLVIKSHTMG